MYLYPFSPLDLISSKATKTEFAIEMFHSKIWRARKRLQESSLFKLKHWILKVLNLNKHQIKTKNET